MAHKPHIGTETCERCKEVAEELKKIQENQRKSYPKVIHTLTGEVVSNGGEKKSSKLKKK